MLTLKNAEHASHSVDLRRIEGGTCRIARDIAVRNCVRQPVPRITRGFCKATRLCMSDNPPNRKTTQHRSPINLRSVNKSRRRDAALLRLTVINKISVSTARQVPCGPAGQFSLHSTQPKTRRIIPDRNALVITQTSVTTHIPMSSIRSADAVSTEREIPVPNATYAAKHAGHFGSNARTSVGSEHFAQANRRRATVGGWALPSAALCELLRAALAACEQQDRFFIGDSHSRSRTQIPSATP